MLWFQNETSVQWMLIAGIILRVILIFIFPGFSDDIYRFYWDGTLILSGYSPYGVLPTDVLKLNIPTLDQTLFELLNSKTYYTIYPPVNQCYFAFGALAGEITTASILLKTGIFMTELLGLFYLIAVLKMINIDKKASMLYFLNPLVVTEGIGNAHFEVVMLSFLCMAIYFILNRNMLKAAFCFSISVGVKLLPLMLLPFLFFSLESRQRYVFFGGFMLFISIIFLPIFDVLATSSLLSSVDLYFRKFEFNASVYYILRFIGKTFSGYNLINFIGPALALLTVWLNVRLACRRHIFSHQNFLLYCLWVWTIYLLMATTVHPWYIISLVFFAVLTQTHFSFVWSYLAFISYVNYSYHPYFENLWYIGLEYGLLVIILLLEWKSNNRLKFSNQLPVNTSI
jgi:hypothetical protein